MAVTNDKLTGGGSWLQLRSKVSGTSLAERWRFLRPRNMERERGNQWRSVGTRH